MSLETPSLSLLQVKRRINDVDEFYNQRNVHNVGVGLNRSWELADGDAAAARAGRMAARAAMEMNASMSNG